MLNPDAIVNLSKETLHPYKCNWEGCKTKCNSWNTYSKHVYIIHCKSLKEDASLSDTTEICRWKTTTLSGVCSFSFEVNTAGIKLLWDHIHHTHFSKLSIRCPYKGCTKRFTKRPKLIEHYVDVHKELPPESSTSSPFHLQLYQHRSPYYHRENPMAQSTLSPLQALPKQPISLFKIYQSQIGDLVRPTPFDPSSSQTTVTAYTQGQDQSSSQGLNQDQIQSHSKSWGHEGKQKRIRLEKKQVSEDEDLSEDDCSVTFEDLDYRDTDYDRFVFVAADTESGEKALDTMTGEEEQRPILRDDYSNIRVVVRSNEETNSTARMAMLPPLQPSSYKPRIVPVSTGFDFMQKEYNKFIKEGDKSQS